MLLITSETIPGRNFAVLGLVKGTVVQAKHVGRDIMAGLKSLVGGEIHGYTEMMAEARAIATRRMVAEADRHGTRYVGNDPFRARGRSRNQADRTAVQCRIRTGQFVGFIRNTRERIRQNDE